MSLCTFAQKYIHDLDTSKEIVHDIFINLWEKRDSIDMQKAWKTYLFTSVHNRCLNYIRDHKKFQHNQLIEEYNDTSTWEPDNNLLNDEIRERIEKALNKLPDRCRQILVMNRFDGFKYKEIAEKLDLSVKTVETQMSKALKILRENLIDLLIILFLILWLFNMKN